MKVEGRYTVVYDGQCKVCSRSAKLLRKWDPNHDLEIIASQTPEVTKRFPWIGPQAYVESIQVVRNRDAKTWQGAAALEQLLNVLPKGRLISWLFKIPFARPLIDKFYKWFARNRYGLGCAQHCVSLAVTALLLCACSTASIVATPSPVTWVQVWSDEFDGAAGARIDETKWTYQTADGCKEGICGWGNTEKEYYTDARENIALNGQGQLAIVARSASAGLTCYYGPCRYTSGKVTTRGKMLAQPGRVEARIKLPAGQGLWPAFWMLGHTSPTTPWPASGEIDIMENKGSQAITTSSALHGPGYSGQTPFAHAHDLASGALADDFHAFAVEWDSLVVRFFVDGALHYEIARDAVERYGKSVLDQPYFVILNLAVGGHFDGDPQSDAIFPATMLVDYVRVYVRQ